MAVLATTSKKRGAWIEWLGRCRNGVFVNQLFFDKTIGGVPEPWTDAIVALEMTFRAGEYTPKSAWSYNFRGIGGAVCSCTRTGRCSLHSHGIAIDIDPKLNPFIRTTTFSWNDTAFTPEQIALVEGIRNTKGEQLWFWAGRWNTIKDYMHFETNVDPDSAEVDWSTVPDGIGDDMQSNLNALKAQTMEWYVNLAAQTGHPGGIPEYWGVDYVGHLTNGVTPTDQEWLDAYDELWTVQVTASTMGGSATDLGDYYKWGSQCFTSVCA